MKGKGLGRTIDGLLSMEGRLVDDLWTPHEKCAVLQGEKSRRHSKLQNYE